MKRTTDSGRQGHLSEAELFGLAVPPAGEPEALPGHLSECLACSRALSEWKAAVRELASEETEAIDRRSDAEWTALENKTITAIRRLRAGRRASWRWVAAIAAALALFAVALPLRHRGPRSATARASVPSAEMSPQDRADDALLRDVARLSRGDESADEDWSSLVPDPDGNGGNKSSKL
ncbi:MAG TPA: hypothetical protein VKJ00_07290 [Thermoanaerobaculia bacterium]|nr:hypothetical protein [Thermoanaerobaculia bacterium]